MALSIEKIIPYLKHTLGETSINIGKEVQKTHVGKVRDTYMYGKKRVLVTTDRQSAFDLNLAEVPFKGQVLNKCAYFWFKKTKHIISNHTLSLVDPNILVAKEASVFPVEFVVRAYMTGTTDTSIWVNYNSGVRNFCGHILPDGIENNTLLPEVIVTPTTKPEKGHDESISREEIIDRGLMTAEDFDYVSKKALEIFTLGQEHCKKNGLILVDTKYEFGTIFDENGDKKIIIVDEIHTPDSSRFWDLESYSSLVKSGKSPKSFDKDVLRKWYSDRCDPYGKQTLPKAPKELIAKLSRTYQQAYEKITGEEFIPETSLSPNTRMEENLKKYIKLDS